jgi:hypothetical protein
MRPLIGQELMKGRLTDLHREADRERMARAASRTRHTRQEKRRRRLMPDRPSVLARRVLTTLSALIPSSTMPALAASGGRAKKEGSS